MIISYVSSVMDAEDFAALFQDKQTMPFQQGQKYHRLMMEGLATNGAIVHACSARPVTKGNCKRKFLPRQTRQVHPGLTYRYASILNIPVLKHLWQMAAAYHAICREKRQGTDAVLCDVLNASAAFGAALAAKRKKLPCLGIVTDLPELLVTGVRKGRTRLVHKTIGLCSGYVFLTEAMNDSLNKAGKPYTVIEGVCDGKMQKMQKPASSENAPLICLYAGYLDERYGVKMMVDSFLQCAHPHAELHIFGSGPYAKTLSDLVKTHPCLHFHGTKLNKEIVQAERKAHLLLNPRPPEEAFTKYSFPSKNMEYMASGTPMLAYALSGIPKEYDPYYFHAENTEDGFRDTLLSVLQMPEEERRNMGERARQFVLTEKTAEVQSKKIFRLLEGTK